MAPRPPLTVPEIEEMAETLRGSVLHMLALAKSGHPAGSLGMAEILATLYFGVMQHDPDNPDWEGRDLFILSNGHVAPIQYAAMAHSGYFPVEELDTLRQFGTRLQGHPERKSLPGLETTSGPLGEGISQAAGMAYVLKYLDKNPHRFVYTTVGDGELNEGNLWEAIMFAAKYRLGQMITFVDRNYIQIDGSTEDVMPLDNLRDKFDSFGWHVLTVNGHSVAGLLDAIQTAQAVVDRPTCIIAYTIPGKGVADMEYDFRWHGKAPTIEQRDAWRAARGEHPHGFDHLAAEKEN